MSNWYMVATLAAIVVAGLLAAAFVFLIR